MLGRIVGHGILPAVPDDEQPGTGEDAHGMRVVVAASEGLAIELGRPGVGASRVAGEVADGIAELLVGSPAEAHSPVFAGLPSAGRDASQAGQRLRRREAGTAVADLGQQASGADGASAGQAVEDVGVGVQGELLLDLLGEDPDLLNKGAQGSQESTGDMVCCSRRGVGLIRPPRGPTRKAPCKRSWRSNWSGLRGLDRCRLPRRALAQP
jgi:hypothetical protein